MNKSLPHWVGIVLCFVAGIIAIQRFMIPTHELSPAGSYEAVAHLFVGGLIGAKMVGWLFKVSVAPCGWLALVMTVTELVAFFTLKR